MNKERVLELRETGLSYGEISKMLDMSRSSVISIVKRSQEPKFSTVVKGSTKNLDTIV